MRKTVPALCVALLVSSSSAGQSFNDFARDFQTGIQIYNDLKRLRGQPQPHHQPSPNKPWQTGPLRPAPQYQAKPGQPQTTSGQQARRLSRSGVAEIQQRLKDLGYDPGPIDGVEGRKTRAALRDWELASGLPVHGRLTRETLAALRAAVREGPQATSRSASGDEGPSFDCARALAPDEIAICASPDLAARDRALSAAYQHAMSAAAPDKRARIVGDQRSWLSSRNSCGADESCLVAVMDARIKALAGTPSAQSAPATAGAKNAFAPRSGRAELVADSAEIPAPAGPGQLSQEERSGYLFVGGRLAAVTTKGIEQREMFQAPVSLHSNLGSAIFHIAAPWLRRPRDDDAALSLYRAFDEAAKREIAEEGFQKPYREIAPLELIKLGQDAAKPTAWFSPFVARRLADATRARLDRLFTKETLNQPVPLRVYCNALIGRYDFPTASFPIEGTGCRSQISAGLPSKGGAEWIFAKPPSPPGGVLERIPVPPEQAEAFENRPEAPWVLISFETEMTLEKRDSEAGPIATVSFSAADNFAVHRNYSLTDVMLRLGSTAAPQAGASTVEPGNRVWRLHDAEEVAALVGLAGTTRELPADGRTLAAQAGAPLGVITLTSSQVHNYRRGESVTANPLHRGSGANGPVLAVALALPEERIIDLPTARPDTALKLYALLPRPASSYRFTAPQDYYGRQSFFSETDLQIHSAHLFELSDRKRALVLVANPLEGRFFVPRKLGHSDTREKEVLERFPFESPPDLPSYDIIEVPPRVALIKEAAERFGLDATALVRNNLPQSVGTDAFAQQERTQQLLSAAPIGDHFGAGFWVQGALRLKQYDFSSESFAVSQVTLQPIDILRRLDVERSAVRFELRDEEVLAVHMPPDQGRAFAEAFSGELTLRARVRARRADVTSYGDLRVYVDILEAEILAPDSIVTIRDPQRVVYRYSLAPEVEAKEQRSVRRVTREEAEVKLDEFLAKAGTHVVMIRPAGSTKIETVYTGGFGGGQYQGMLMNSPVHLPRPDEVTALLRPAVDEVADIMRAKPDFALLLNRNMLIKREPQVEPEYRKLLITLLMEHDLAVQPFPPEPMLNEEQAARLSSLWPAGAEYAVLRRRDDDAPVTKVVVHQSEISSYRQAIFDSRRDRHIRDALPSISYELPESAKAEIFLADLLKSFREENSIAAVVSRETMQRIFPEIANLDLTVRQFPPEEVHAGIPKDYARQGASEFSILGLKGGADKNVVLDALASEFKPADLEPAEGGRLRGIRGACPSGSWLVPGTLEEVGSFCVELGFVDGLAKHIVLRQVLRGDATEAALEAFRQRYGGDPWLRETRHFERDVTCWVYGWGALLDADRTALGRADAKTPPSVLEAVLWRGGGVTTIVLQLDDEKGAAEAKAEQTPQIKF